MRSQLAHLLHYFFKTMFMNKKPVTYFSKNTALKILERPIEVDLQTLLSATFAISRSRVVRNHIQHALMQLASPDFKMTA